MKTRVFLLSALALLFTVSASAMEHINSADPLEVSVIEGEVDFQGRLIVGVEEMTMCGPEPNGIVTSTVSGIDGQGMWQIKTYAVTMTLILPSPSGIPALYTCTSFNDYSVRLGGAGLCYTKIEGSTNTMCEIW